MCWLFLLRRGTYVGEDCFNATRLYRLLIGSTLHALQTVRLELHIPQKMIYAKLGLVWWIDFVYASDILWLCKLAPHSSTCLGEFQRRVPHPCHAVRSNALRNEILFDEEGNYAGFDRNAPTSASGGKPKVLKLMKLGQRKQLAFRFTSLPFFVGNLLGNHKCIIIMNNDILFILHYRCTYSEMIRNQSSCNVVLYASIASLALHTADALSAESCWGNEKRDTRRWSWLVTHQQVVLVLSWQSELMLRQMSTSFAVQYSTYNQEVEDSISGCNERLLSRYLQMLVKSVKRKTRSNSVPGLHR